jgi:hypothetical protein
MIRSCIVVTALSLAAGCAQMRATMGEDDQGRTLASLIGYAQNVAAMRPDAQRRELNDAKQTYTKDSGPYARLRLALLLSLPGTAFVDDVAAAGLLEPLIAAPTAESPRTDALRQLAAWLHAQLAERTREQKKSAQLKDQLDALRAIERTLIDRSQGPAR